MLAEQEKWVVIIFVINYDYFRAEHTPTAKISHAAAVKDDTKQYVYFTLTHL